MQLTKSGFFKVMILLLAALKLVTIPLMSSDLHIWVAEGLKILSTPHLIQTDISSIHHLSLNYPSPLSSLLLGIIYKYFGDVGLFIFLRLFLFIFLSYFVALKPLQHINIGIKTFGVAVISMVGSEFMVDRPAIFALPFLWYFVSLFNKIRSEEKISWPLYIILMALWTNLHPSVIIIIPLSLYALLITKFNRRVSYLLFFGLLSLHLTPIGLGIWRYVYDTIKISHIRMLEEWTSILHFSYPYYGLLYLLTLSITLILVVKKRKLHALVASIYFPLMLIGLWNARNITFFFLFLIPIFQSFSLIEDSTRAHNFSTQIDTTLAFTLFVLLIVMTYKNPLHEEGFRQLNLIHKKLGKRVFTGLELSGAVCALTSNRSKTFVDSRNIIFSDAILKDYFDIIKGHNNALSRLDFYSIDTIFLPKSAIQINQVLASSPSWRKDFEDNSYELWKKR